MTPLRLAASTALLLALCACGGTWSNEDLLFLAAVPSERQLTAKLPDSAGTTQGGLSTRRDGLALGEPSELYRDTRSAADGFNAGVRGLLRLLDTISRYPPTTREPDRRIWGPARAESHPGFEARVVISRTREAAATQYQWSIEFRPQGGGEEAWRAVALGAFAPTEDLERGAGTISLRAAEARANGTPFEQLDPVALIEIAYQTAADPLTVDITFHPNAGAPVDLVRYAYREAADGSGSIGFTRSGADGYPGPAVETLTVVSRWIASGEGRADATVSGGDVPSGTTPTLTECWDRSFSVVHAARSWDAAAQVGSPSACALSP